VQGWEAPVVLNASAFCFVVLSKGAVMAGTGYGSSGDQSSTNSLIELGPL
jgi:hypothetical protein